MTQTDTDAMLAALSGAERTALKNDSLREINAELLAALRAADQQINFWRNTFAASQGEQQMPKIAPSETVRERIRAAIARAEGEGR